MDVSVDYTAVTRVFEAQKLPAFMSYTESASARGIARDDETPIRLLVDTRTGRVLERAPSPTGETHGHGDSPPTRYMFAPQCYTATAERDATWNGRRALAFAMHFNGGGTCNQQQSFAITMLYADPQTHEPIGADGSETDDNMTIDFSMTYARFGGYVLPSTLSAHAHGHGWLFWARERASVVFSDYAFSEVRRQSVKALPAT